MASTVQEPLFASISDQSLALLLPIVVYWAYSLIFHWASSQEFPWLEKYRIHSKEEETRNRVELPDVIKAVVVQQLLQTALGFLAVLADDSEMVFDDDLALAQYQSWILFFLSNVGLGTLASPAMMATVAHVCYFYLEPLVRFTVAMAILDTWQYFLHRLFHNVPFLYRHFHSRHHRLYVTYAFGALYNHPFEGFLMDSVGASLAFLISGMGNRGALAFFSFSTLKTLDDHCGYNLPFNPLQKIFSNNADYHDIHHQHFGIKSNFSQPFGTMWDHILGTHMSREEANEIIRRKNERRAAASKVPSIKSINNSNIMYNKAIISSAEEKSFRSSSSSSSSGNNNGNNSGNNSGNDSHAEDNNDHDEQARKEAGVIVSSNPEGWLPSPPLSLRRERLSTRAQVDNGVVSGKGQGKAL
ncbi:hypothetical protein EDD11_007345 [Mortierella claussenii]|nr:hypothetical protein EDD11_007345 [Mortierella claussenii]